MIEINWKPSAKELKSFGKAICIGFFLIALLFAISKNFEIAGLLFGISIIIGGVIWLTGCKVFIPIYLLWMGIAYVMGNIISRVLLFAIYYLILFPTSMFMKIFHRDRLDIREKRDSYWKKAEQYEALEEVYMRQY